MATNIIFTIIGVAVAGIVFGFVYALLPIQFNEYPLVDFAADLEGFSSILTTMFSYASVFIDIPLFFLLLRFFFFTLTSFYLIKLITYLVNITGFGSGA